VFIPASIPPGRYILWVAANAIYGGRAVRVGPNVAPVATAQALTTPEEAALAVTLAGSDVDYDPLSFAVVATPSNGTLTGTAPNLTYTPAANYSGPDSFTFKANDGNVDSAPATISITVTPVNDAPVFDAIANQTLLEDTPAGVSLSGVGPGGGVAEAAQTLTITATSSNPALVPNPTVTGSGSTRTLSFSPAANANGTVTITVTAKDNGGTANGGIDTLLRTFGITVTPVNDAPVFDALADQTVLEDSAASQALVTGIGPGGGADEASQTLTVTATSSNPSVVPNPTATGSGTTRTLSFTPVANANGTASITVTAQDSGGTANGGSDTLLRTFIVTVTPVNDAPVFDALANATVLEDSINQVALVANVSPGGGADEATQTVTLVATSSNPAIVPNPTVTGSGTARNLNFAPATNAVGTVTMTVTAQDSGGTANGGVDTFSRTFTITVTPVNDAPVFDALPVMAVLEDAATQTTTVTGVGPGGGLDESAQTVTLSATSNNVTLIPNPTVTGSGNTRTLSFTPVANATGTATITVTAQDSGGTANGGSDTFSRTFSVTVTPLNHAPTLDAVADVTALENAATQAAPVTGLSPGGGPDEAWQTLTVTATSSNLALAPNPTVTGTGGSRTLSFTPVTNAVGTATITVTVRDSGGTANGGIDASSRTFSLTVTPVNQAPAFALIPGQTLYEDKPTNVPMTGIGPGGGPDEAGQVISVTATSSDQTLVPNPTVSGSGTSRVLSFAPAAHALGTVTITVTARDSGGTANGGVNTFTRTFGVTLAPVNSPPEFDAIADVTVLEDAPAQEVVLVSVGPGGGPDELSQEVAVTATSSNPLLVSELTVAGSGASRTLSFVPVANAAGTVTVTVTARDTGGTANGGKDAFSRTFGITLTPVNDAPAFDAVADQSVQRGFDSYPVTVTGVGSGGGADEVSQTITLTATSSDPTLVPDPIVSGEGANRTLMFAPASKAAEGFVTITVTAQDSGGTANGGADTYSRTFGLTVTPSAADAEKHAYYGWQFGQGCGCSGGGEGGGPLGLAAFFLAALVLRGRKARHAVAMAPLALALVALAIPRLALAEEAVSAQAPAPTAKRMKLAFLGVSSSAGVPADAANSVSGFVQAQLVGLDAYDVTSSDDIRAMLGAERQKQLLGCSESSTTCLTEIAGALDSDRALTGDLSHVGETTLLNLSLVDLKASKPVARVTRRFEGSGSVERVLDSVGPAVFELVSADPALQGKKLKFERGYGGFLVGVRGEVEFAGKSLAPAVMAELSGKRLGVLVAVVIGPTPGFRAEGRVYPIDLGRLRPYVGVGGTVFAPAVGLRGAAGAEVRFGQLHLFADGAFEYFVNSDAATHNPYAVLVSAGAGWLF
jgi:MYXO-CTERM domain-containing protein